MKTIIHLTKKQAGKLLDIIQRQYDSFDEKTYPEHNDWKLEFNDDGSIDVWSGRHGYSTKDIKQKVKP